MISFLNAFLLSALALSLIPIVIHLLNRKKTRRIAFSSLKFLKELQKNKMKKLKLRQYLLLLLRCLALLLAVIAFARPVAKADGGGDIAQHGKTSVVIILDRSMSTAFISEKGIVLEQMKAKAIELIDFLKEGDEALIMTMPGSSGEQFSQNFSELRALIKNTGSSNARADLQATAALAYTAFDKAKNPNREIYVLSDFQKNVINQDAAYDKPVVKMPISVTLIDFSLEPQNQLGIVRTEITSKIIEKGKPVRLDVGIKNFGRSGVTDRPVTIYLQGRRVAQSVVSLASRDEITLDIPITPDRSGVLQGYAELDDDGLMGDNHSYFHLTVPGKIDVLAMADQPEETEFLSLALNPSKTEESPVKLQTVRYSEAGSIDFSDYRVIIACDPAKPDEILMRRFDRFLKDHGNLILLPGERTNISEFNQTWAAVFDLSRIVERVEPSGAEKSYVEFGEIEQTHPIVGGLFQKARTAIQSPQFFRYYKLAPSSKSRAIIRLTSRSDFIQEYPYGSGRIMLWASPPLLDWNDLPLRGIFAPLMHRSVYYLNAGESIDRFTCGEPLELTLPAAATQDIKIESYGGSATVAPKLRRLGESLLISAPLIEEAGNYSVKGQNEIIGFFDANVPTSESDLTRADETSLKNLFEGQTVQTLPGNAAIEKYILQSRFGSELWKWFIAAVILILLVEMAIAQSHRLAFLFNRGKI